MFGTKDISENITQCNLHSHGQFLQAQSHLLMLPRVNNKSWHLSLYDECSIRVTVVVCHEYM